MSSHNITISIAAAPHQPNQEPLRVPNMQNPPPFEPQLVFESLSMDQAASSIDSTSNFLESTDSWIFLQEATAIDLTITFLESTATYQPRQCTKKMKMDMDNHCVVLPVLPLPKMYCRESTPDAESETKSIESRRAQRNSYRAFFNRTIGLSAHL
jgi:hypothetical protein